MAEVNNRLNNDYFSEIVTLKTGYFAGKPISYTYSKQRLKDEPNVDYRQVMRSINRFLVKNAISDKDAEDTKMAAICGILSETACT